MKLLTGDVYLETLRELEDNLGTEELNNFLGQWFGGIGKDVILQALDNYRKGLERPIYEIEVETGSDALRSIRGIAVKIPRRHNFLSRLRYLMFG